MYIAEYAKYHVFSTFETDFCTKSENSPPQWQRECVYFDSGLGRELGHKINPSLGEDLLFLFWFSPNFGHKTVPIPSENRFSWFYTSETAPIANSWLRACSQL